MSFRDRFPREPEETAEQYESRLAEIEWAHGMAARENARHRDTDERCWTGDPRRGDGL